MNIIEQYVVALEKKQMIIVKNRLLEKNIVMSETSTRFPNVCEVTFNNSTYWFYNDGSDKGLFICGFKIQFTGMSISMDIIENCPPELL